MSDSNRESCNVHWKENNIDISKPGIYTYIGTVEGYNGEVKLTLKVNGEIPYGMGNSSGNISNINGYGNNIYYVDNNDNNALYKINLDGSYRIKLSKKSINYINILDGEIYYNTLDNQEKIYKLYLE